MANKNTKFRTMYTEIGTKEGKTYTEESKTDKSQAEDVDIYY